MTVEKYGVVQGEKKPKPGKDLEELLEDQKETDKKKARRPSVGSGSKPDKVKINPKRKTPKVPTSR